MSVADKKVLTVQDISCVGQCSLTVALPILSACGIETAVLPSAVLSTHTAFSGYTCRDLTDDMPAIADHWDREGIRFDAVYTGYLGSAKQVDIVMHIMQTLCKPDARRIVDPAMADNGRLYPAFDAAFVQEMKRLCCAADIILPNLTEACLLTGMEYRESYDEAYIRAVLEQLSALGAKTIVLTGIGYRPDRTGVVVWESGRQSYYEHHRLAKGSHGTGDVYASAFTGALMHGCSVQRAAQIAADYTVRCIETTASDASHWYGVKFEQEIPALLDMLGR